MSTKKAIDTLEGRLRDRLQSEYNSIVSLIVEYERRFPEERRCNDMLRNLLRLLELGLDTNTQVEYLNKYFDEIKDY